MQTMSDLKVQLCPGLAAALAEGIHWDSRRQRLFWVDILHPWLYWFEPATASTGRLALSQPGCWLLGTDSPALLIGMSRSIGLLDPETGKVRELPQVQLQTEPAGNRLNDGGADLQGRLWFGTMDNAEQTPSGQLYRWDQRGLHTVDTGYVVTNGPVFTQDGQFLYHASSSSREVYRFALSQTGELVQKQIFIRFSEAQGFPDGMALDADGGLWVAQWRGYGISRFDRNGHLTRTIALPVSNVTNLAFAGPDLRQLFVTTAQAGLTPMELQQQPAAGRLFRLELEIPGVQVPAVKLSSLALPDSPSDAKSQACDCNGLGLVAADATAEKN